MNLRNLLLAVVLATTTANARLFETEAQLKSRYGSPAYTGDFNSNRYFHQDLRLDVWLLEKSAHRIEYRRLNKETRGFASFTEQDIAAIRGISQNQFVTVNDDKTVVTVETALWRKTAAATAKPRF